MKKSMYSLILMDEVVSEVDKLALEQSTNRSNIINQILAEYVSLITPEKRINNIFHYIENCLQSHNDFALNVEPHDLTMSVKSALEYKYRPTIKYDVQLYRTPTEAIGELHVIFRTTSASLLVELTDFFKIWTQLEDLYIRKFFPEKEIHYTLDEGRFTRTFTIPHNKQYSPDDIGHAISEYIAMFDEILKGYLAAKYRSVTEIENRYVEYLNRGLFLI